jgi:DNA-binding response OmpR family regulator
MKLLIVDDEFDLCQMLAEHFKDEFDTEVFTATTPAEALRLLEEQQPDGMLLDIHLRSRMTGFDILAKLKEISPATKVIMVTSDINFSSVEKALELGAVDYITKPFTADYLKQTVDLKIARHLIQA